MRPDPVSEALKLAPVPASNRGLERTIAAARRSAPRRSRLAPPRRLVLIACALLLLGLTFTSPGQAAVDWLGDLVGLGQVGGPPSAHRQLRQIAPTGREVVIGNGSAPDGTRYEVVEFQGKGEGTCFALDFLPVGFPENTGTCTQGQHQGALNGFGVSFPGRPGRTGSNPSVGRVSGIVGPAVARVEIRWTDVAGRRGGGAAKVIFPSREIRQRIGARTTAGYLLGFLPRRYRNADLRDGGAITLVAYDRHGKLLARQQLPPLGARQRAERQARKAGVRTNPNSPMGAVPPIAARGHHSVQQTRPPAPVAAAEEAARQARREFNHAGLPTPHGVYLLPPRFQRPVIERCRAELRDQQRRAGRPSGFECKAFLLVNAGVISPGSYTPKELRAAVSATR